MSDWFERGRRLKERLKSARHGDRLTIIEAFAAEENCAAGVARRELAAFDLVQELPADHASLRGSVRKLNSLTVVELFRIYRISPEKALEAVSLLEQGDLTFRGLVDFKKRLQPDPPEKLGTTQETIKFLAAWTKANSTLDAAYRNAHDAESEFADAALCTNSGHRVGYARFGQPIARHLIGLKKPEQLILAAYMFDGFIIRVGSELHARKIDDVLIDMGPRGPRNVQIATDDTGDLLAACSRACQLLATADRDKNPGITGAPVL